MSVDFSGLILYVRVNIYSVISGWGVSGLSHAKQQVKCFAQGRSAPLAMRLEPATIQSPVKCSTS